ncbi:MAG: 50S ribosomal protein L13 [Candidatus Woesearchaeota archaeon]
MIINAQDMIVGRLGTVVAKKALQGEEVSIVNAEKAVITGKKDQILARFKQKRQLGAPLIGPHFPKTSERILKRMIRGMLPYKKPRGREAFERIKCYKGIPKQFEGKKMETIEGAHVDKTNARYITIQEVSKQLGAKA